MFGASSVVRWDTVTVSLSLRYQQTSCNFSKVALKQGDMPLFTPFLPVNEAGTVRSV